MTMLALFNFSEIETQEIKANCPHSFSMWDEGDCDHTPAYLKRSEATITARHGREREGAFQFFGIDLQRSFVFPDPPSECGMRMTMTKFLTSQEERGKGYGLLPFFLLEEGWGWP